MFDFKSRRSGGVAIAIFAVAFLVLIGASPAIAQIDKNAQKCLNEYNKRLQKLSAAQGKVHCGCIKDFSKGKITDPGACFPNDPFDAKDKVTKAETLFFDKVALRCSFDPNDPGFPDFGVGDPNDAADAAIQKEFDLFEDIFGADLGDPNLSPITFSGSGASSSDKNEFNCQRLVALGAKKCQDTKLKEFNKCKRLGLKSGAITDADSLRDECFRADPNDPSVAGQPDPKGTISKKCVGQGKGIDRQVQKKCIDKGIGNVFPGECGAEDPNDLAVCVDRLVECRVCLMVNAVDGLDRDCDLFDDGTVNGSCGASPAVCGDGIISPGEACDTAGDDSACPGLCSSLCTCPGSHPFVLDPVTSGATVVGALAPGSPLPLSGFTGSISLDVGAPELGPGVFPISVPVGALPPVDVLGVVTVCTFLEEDPGLPASGISGTGLLNCLGVPLATPPSPDFALHLDHCTAGTACDSFPAGPTTCPSIFGLASTIDPGSGLCVPELPPDPGCVAVDPATGGTATPEGALGTHPFACNSPQFLVPSATPWAAGDAFFTLNLSLDIRGPADACVGPPVAAANVLPFTTGAAASTLFDAFGTPGSVQSVGGSGTPFSCPAVLNSTTAGAEIVTAFGALDQALLGPPVDINTFVLFTGM